MSSVEEEQRREGFIRELFPDEDGPGQWVTEDPRTGGTITIGEALDRMGVGAGAFEIEPEAGSPKYLALLDKMRDLHIRKNAGYAGVGNVDPWRNFRMAEDFGVEAWRGALIRASDKWSRIISLLENPENEQVGEALNDTLFDLAAYCLIVRCLRDEAGLT